MSGTTGPEDPGSWNTWEHQHAGQSLPSFPYGSTELEANEDRLYGFEFDAQTNSLRVTGYAPSDVRELLAAYREHMQLLISIGRQASGLGDTFRSGPGPIPSADL